MISLQDAITNQWYNPKPWGKALWPLAKIFEFIVKIRKLCYSHKIFASSKPDSLVIVVGNLTVGGTGKTPLVISLVKVLQQKGFKVGVLLRGYKGRAHGALHVLPNMDPALVGDEAVLLTRNCNCPVVVAKKRVLGANKLVKDFAVDVIISDDGLQHYALARDIEIVIMDGERGVGNGACLPQGPLRETVDRLQHVDMVITNGIDMRFNIDKVYSLLSRKHSVDINHFIGKTVHAIAGIGTPNKFFAMLTNLGINVIPHPFPDHYVFTMQDVNFRDQLPILMTEKDAVKCQGFASNRCWVVSVHAEIEPVVLDKFASIVQGVENARQKIT